MVENVVDDGVEPKQTIIEVCVETSVDVKSIIEVKVNVKIPYQAYIEAKPKLTGVSELHDYELTPPLFLTNDR